MAQALDYAPPRRRMTRRRIVTIVIACVLVATGIAAWRWWTPLVWRIEYVRLQRDCMNYSAPADRVVYTTDPAEAKRLIALGGGYHGVYVPATFDTVAGFEPAEFAKVQSFKAMYGGPRSSIAFMHERRSASGERRLIVLDCYDTNGGKTFGFWVYNMKPVALFSSQRLLLIASGDELFHPKKSLRIFAGEPDANDGSKFAIRFDMDGKSGVVDGQLTNSGGITLAIRNP
jgi:hypothetical protein